MNVEAAKNATQHLLRNADIQLNGDRPWDPQFHNAEAFRRILRSPSLGLGESYMDGWWDCEALDEFFYRVIRHVPPKEVYTFANVIRHLLRNYLTNQQTLWRSKRVAEQHYNLGNDLYTRMLGETMAYTCAYWRDVNTLDEAQYAKYELICRKIDLQPNDEVLELGCGWGGFAKYAAERYGCRVVAVNISTEQMKYAAAQTQHLPVELHVCDYRNHSVYNPKGQRFDKVVSIGMCEHVGQKNYGKFLQTAHDQLKNDGLFLMHTIGKNESIAFTDPWVNKYIFPGGQLPSLKWITAAAENRFVVEDIHNFGADYDLTLMAWYDNFLNKWPELESQYDERFKRMWRYYLLSCAGGFRARSMQLWQFVFSPKGVLHGYQSVR